MVWRLIATKVSPPLGMVAIVAALIFGRLGENAAQASELEPSFGPTIDDWGEYGLMQVPSARPGTDGDFQFFYSDVSPYSRFGIDVTALPWLEAAFRYTSIANRLYGPVSFSGHQSYKDRSFSVKIRLIKENRYFPETSIGIRDLAGTGLFSSEYLAFTRRIYNFDITAGLGWGLMSSNVSVPNPLGVIFKSFKNRPTANTAGNFSFSYFHGKNVGLFGGIEYHTPIHGLNLKLELDPDSYQNEPLGNRFDVKSPINVGVVYSPLSFLQLSAGFERGTTLMLRATLHTNFNHPGLPIFDTPPPKVPLRPRPAPPVGKPLDETADLLVPAQPEPPHDGLILRDVATPVSAMRDLGTPMANGAEPPVGLPLDETSLPLVSTAASSTSKEVDALFDAAARLGATIDNVDINGGKATLVVFSARQLRSSERAELKRQALVSLPDITRVVINQGSSRYRLAGRRAAPAGKRLSQTKLPTLAVDASTINVNRLYDGAHDLGYRIENVQMHGDVATISVTASTRLTHHGRDKLVRLALANLPGTAHAVVLDTKRRRRTDRAQADRVFADLNRIGFRGLSYAVSGRRATLVFSQSKYRNTAKAIGRAARVMLRHVPAKVESITLDLVQSGLTTVSVTLQRSDLERALRNNGSPEEVWADARIAGSDPAPVTGIANRKAYPNFTWSLAPKMRQQLGGPNNFYIYEIYAALSGEVTLRRGLTVGGVLGADLVDNLNQLTLTSNSKLPHVRSDIKDYLKQGKYGIYDLQADYMFDIAPNWYGRVSVGYLEEMYGGFDGEVLYRPYHERWAVGLDINHVWKRDFNELFGFQKYQVTTGHLSFYYKLPFYHLTAAVHIGQYLAGDRGATFEISRQFDNGIIAGVFATKTNVSAAQFGEGSFDKGFYISIPLDLFFGQPTTARSDFLYRPLTRDGGQMLTIKKPLYQATDGADPKTLSEEWPHLFD